MLNRKDAELHLITAIEVKYILIISVKIMVVIKQNLFVSYINTKIPIYIILKPQCALTYWFCTQILHQKLLRNI